MTAKKVFLVAAEPSGDLLGREVAEALRARDGDVVLEGIGGSEMVSVGLKSDIDIAPLSVLGFVEGLMAYRDVVRLADEAADRIIAAAPAAVVLIDSWGFMLRLAQRLRARAPDIRLIKLIGPQIWATRAGRAKTLAQTVDHVLCIHDIEPAYYVPHGLKATVIGNPALSRIERGDGARFRAGWGIEETDRILLVLPGSRPGEIKRVAPVLIEAAKQVAARRPDLTIVHAPSPAVQAAFAELFETMNGVGRVVSDDADRLNAMAAADLALACSGTVTTELAIQRTPMIVGYKTGWITWALARGLLYQKKHIALLNILSDDREIVPEFVQTRFTAENIAQEAARLLDDEKAMQALLDAQVIALQRMQTDGDDAADRAAAAILEDLGST